MKKEKFYDELFEIQNLLTDSFGKSVPDMEKYVKLALIKVNVIIRECFAGDMFSVISGDGEKVKLLNERIDYLQKQLDKITISVPNKEHEPTIIHPVNPPKNEGDFYRPYPGGPIQPTC